MTVWYAAGHWTAGLMVEISPPAEASTPEDLLRAEGHRKRIRPYLDAPCDWEQPS